MHKLHLARPLIRRLTALRPLTRCLYSTNAPSASAGGNPEEMRHFAELAASWWDSEGPQRILHKMNLMRMDYIRDILKQHRPGAPGFAADLFPVTATPKVSAGLGSDKQLAVLDIGCGGGLLCESLARQADVASVLGIDVTPEVLAVANSHADLDPKLLGKLKYKQSSVEALDSNAQFDLVTMFEVIEHLDNPASTLRCALNHVKPGGWIFLSTINRTLLARLTLIEAAENVFGIVPPGTHTYSKFICEQELRDFFAQIGGWTVANTQGCVYVPPSGWRRFDGKSTGVDAIFEKIIGRGGGNYLLAARRDD